MFKTDGKEQEKAKIYAYKTKRLTHIEVNSCDGESLVELYAEIGKTLMDKMIDLVKEGKNG